MSNGYTQYKNHIQALQKRVSAIEKSESFIIPKDLFMKLKFKEFKICENNQIEFITNPEIPFSLSYEIDE